MSLLDGIDELEEQLDDYVKEMSEALLFEFASRHCRYIINRRDDESTFFAFNNVYTPNGSSYMTNGIECSQVAILRDYTPRLYAVNPDYPILIENWGEPTLPAYVQFLFMPCISEQVFRDECPYYEHTSHKGGIVLRNCHPDLLKNSELIPYGVSIIRLDDVQSA